MAFGDDIVVLIVFDAYEVVINYLRVLGGVGL